jgi:catechol 2,3-dioxygenase-like lactoylglutathione lyase family enzyme
MGAHALLTGVDHFMIVVSDLAAARRAAVTLLGRSPSWSGGHPQFGTRHELFRLENCYIELLSPDGEGQVADSLRERLAEKGDGIHAIALGTDDVEAAIGTLRERGLRASDPVAGLAHDEPSGAFRRFRNSFLPIEQTHGVPLFVIEHLSESDELPPALPIDDEAATVHAVDHVVVMTPNPERGLALYGDALGIRLALDRSFEKRGVRLIFFRLGGLTIELASSLDRDNTDENADENADDRLYGLSFRVADIDAAHGRLEKAGLELSPVRDGHKPGTRVFMIGDVSLGFPVLIIQHL